MGFIIKPVVIEEMAKLTDKSSGDKVVKHKNEKRTALAQPKYGLIVKPEANKLEIRKEVEALYNVIVVDVSMVRHVGKRQAHYTKAGLVKGQKNAFKKAIVTLKNDDSIDFYSSI